MKTTLQTLLLLTGLLNTGFAQTGVIRGRALDATQQPVPFATVAVLSAADSSFVQGELTDTTGRFVVAALPMGSYRVRITAVGISPWTGPAFELRGETDLGTLNLQAEARTLGEVIVKGERPVVERTMGKLILNVTNSFFKTATNALDVLRRAPGLIVSQDGAISVKGQYAPVVYIDGKQLPLSADELRGLQAGDIDQIEVISNASAQFDGETRAVINIKLKRDKTLGGKGSLYGGYVQNQRYNGGEVGGSGTYKTSRWTHYGRLGYSESNNFLTGLTRRAVDAEASQTVLNSNSLIKRSAKPLSYQFSTDFIPAQNHQIGLFVKGATTRQTDQLTNYTNQSDYAPTRPVVTTMLLNTRSLDRTQAGNVAVDLNYKGTLNQRGDELSAYVDYAHYRTAKTQDFRNDFLTGEGRPTRLPLVLLGQFPSRTAIRSLRADYVRPAGKGGKLEGGIKLTRTNTDNEIRYDTLRAGDPTGGEFVLDPSRSNRFRYQETIVAGYAQVSRTFGPTQIEAGLRAENTQSRGNSLTLNNVVDRQYFRWLPSLKVQRKLGERAVLSAGYSRKMRRPGFYDLNPFTLYLDPYSFTEGNPFLLPTTLTTADLTYQHRDVTFSLNYQRTRDAIVQLPFQDDRTRIIRYTRVNLDLQQSGWADVAATQTLTKWWKMQHYAAVGYGQTVSGYAPGQVINTGSWNAYADGTHNFTLPKGYNLELRYTYVSPRIDYIYQAKGYGTVSLGLQKSVLAGRGNLQLNLDDLFNTYREYFVTQYGNLDVSTLQKRNSRQATLRFTYNFGKSTFNRAGRSSGSAEEEGRAR